MTNPKWPLPEPGKWALEPQNHIIRYPGVEEFVYLITAPELMRCKIGYTKRLPQRVKTIRQNSPTLIELINYFPGDEVFERKLHQEFRNVRLFGEWFSMTKEIVQRFRDEAKLAGAKD